MFRVVRIPSVCLTFRPAEAAASERERPLRFVLPEGRDQCSARLHNYLTNHRED